ncbi:ATPase involved in chromosome partitioning [Halobacteroides halobius DSM 5150]|uniref:ATPase involved in chromosome partitioning n=1 Tax=Halobacteroides halobius (strain ATCC 35273 / DSM 5150 / MD-1) TaxID=748449 RepID=L0K951_HALHC|nr:MinD/ParA family protein [Halobacteroides halobius]AGB40648.1 ATPase involved in chromosome partitioning [Halobacteroides halobius DSM 5150]
MKDQAEKLRNLVKSKKQKEKKEKQVKKETRDRNSASIYAVTSGKGGVGKSNFVANLALGLQQEGKKVIVFDADLGLANLDVILGVTPNYNLNHVISGTKSLEEIIIAGPEGLALIPGGSGIEDLANLSQYQINNLIDHWHKIENKYDIILIDTGAGLSNSVLDFVLAADEVIVISTPEPTSVTDAYGVIKVINTHDADAKIKLVINQVDSRNEGERIGRRLSNTAKEFLNQEIDFLGELPTDKAVVKAVKKRRPFLLEYPHAKIAKSINQIVLELLDKEPKKSQGITGFFSDLLSFN